MRWIAVMIACCLAPAQGQPTFRSSVRLIVQPVTVKDRAGNPVRGLTAADFVVTEDGREQQIAFVEYEELESPPDGRAVPRPNDVTPPTAEPAARPVPGDPRFRGRRLIVLYFDLYRATMADQARTLAGARAYVDRSQAAVDLVAIMVFDGRGVRLRQDFTDDREAIRRTLAVVGAEAQDDLEFGAKWDSGGAFGEDDDTFNMFSADRQLAALHTAVQDLGGIPEIKTLVYFGSGLRLNATDNLAQLRAAVNAAIRANVTINPVDARGLVASAPLGDATQPSRGGVGLFSGAFADTAMVRLQRSQDALYALAKDTGGIALFDTNDLSMGILQAANAVTGYYLVGYYTDNMATDGRYRHVKVALRAGLSGSVFFRAGYYGEKTFDKFTAADKERQLADALRLEDPITEIPIAVEVNYFRLNPVEYFVPVSVRMPGSELTRAQRSGASRVDIDMIGELKDEFGVTHRNVRDRVALSPSMRTIQYETAFTILPGKYTIKLLARNDATGHIGTFQATFVVPDLSREEVQLRTSSVILAAQRVPEKSAIYQVKQKVAQGAANPLVWRGQRLVPSVTRTFERGRPMFVLLHAYHDEPTAPSPVVAFVAFYRGDEKVLEVEPQIFESVWETPSRTVPVHLMVPLTELGSGAYECQITVLDPAGRRAAFWRAPILIAP